MIIRKAENNDWKTIKLILKKTDFSDDDILDVKNILDSKEGCFVAVLDNKIVGTVSGHYHSREANIEQIAVLPEYQGKGIGKQLLDIIIDYFKKKGESKIYAGGVEEKTIPFYLKHGFRKEKEELVKDI